MPGTVSGALGKSSHLILNVQPPDMIPLLDAEVSRPRHDLELSGLGCELDCAGPSTCLSCPTAAASAGSCAVLASVHSVLSAALTVLALGRGLFPCIDGLSDRSFTWIPRVCSFVVGCSGCVTSHCLS